MAGDYSIGIVGDRVEITFNGDTRLELDRTQMTELIADLHGVFLQLLDARCAGNMEELAGGDTSSRIMREIIKAYSGKPCSVMK